MSICLWETRRHCASPAPLPTETAGWITKLSGNEIHDRDRWFVRGQLLFEPTEDLSVRIIADYAEMDETCCTPLRYENDPRTGSVNGPIAASIGSTIIDPADY